MTKTILFTALLSAGAGAFVAGLIHSRDPDRAAAASRAQVTRYVCPMHPQYTSDRPGAAPCCGMQLVQADSGSPSSRASGFPPGTVRLSIEKQQLIGVELAEVRRSSARRQLRLTGRVVPDETRTYVIRARTHGWVRDGSPHTKGSTVRAGDRLADFYSKEVLRAQQDFLFALATREQLKSRALTPEQVRQADAEVLSRADALEALGMHGDDIRRVAEKHEFVRNVPIRAPATGILLERNVSAGQSVMQNEEIFRIADLSRVWVLADVLGLDRKLIRPGQKARVSLQGEAEVHTAVVSDVLAEFDPTSQRLKVRLELANERLDLRPNMFVDVMMEFQLPVALNVPADAILDTGSKKLVYVDRGGGYFEPRVVNTGWHSGDRVEITNGVEAGEHIVAAGNFLIDSESRIKATAEEAGGITAKDPVCGMEVSRRQAELSGQMLRRHDGAYYFCSSQCKQKFDPVRVAGRSSERPGSR